MEDSITFSIENAELINHVKRICRKNLKKPAKICTACPFIDEVIDVMNDHGWKYNPAILSSVKP